MIQTLLNARFSKGDLDEIAGIPPRSRKLENMAQARVVSAESDVGKGQQRGYSFGDLLSVHYAIAYTEALEDACGPAIAKQIGRNAGAWVQHTGCIKILGELGAGREYLLPPITPTIDGTRLVEQQPQMPGAKVLIPSLRDSWIVVLHRLKAVLNREASRTGRTGRPRGSMRNNIDQQAIDELTAILKERQSAVPPTK